MTDVKRYLKQIEYYDSSISTKQEERKRLFEKATSTTPTLKEVVVSGGGNQDKIGDASVMLADLDTEIRKEIACFVEARNSVTKTIDSVTNGRLNKILNKRYVEQKTWEKIACEMGISYQWVCKLHGVALQEVEKIMKESEKNCDS